MDYSTVTDSNREGLGQSDSVSQKGAIVKHVVGCAGVDNEFVGIWRGSVPCMTPISES